MPPGYIHFANGNTYSNAAGTIGTLPGSGGAVYSGLPNQIAAGSFQAMTPEPGSLLVWGLGILGLLAWGRSARAETRTDCSQYRQIGLLSLVRASRPCSGNWL